MLQEKIALITGAAQGIGKEIALCFARQGADMALVDVARDSLESTRAEIEQQGRKCLALPVDVSNTDEVAACVNKCIDSFGRIDILVNNAGITRDNLLLRMSTEEWDSVIAVNLKGTYNFIKALTKPLMKQRAGRIINIASIIGIIGNAGQANYAASKAGIIGLTKSVARELAPRGINVNAIAPGFITTAMTEVLSDEVKEGMLANIPLGRFGEPADVARAALFLASDLSRYLTGQVIVVDGGMVM